MLLLNNSNGPLIKLIGEAHIVGQRFLQKNFFGMSSLDFKNLRKKSGARSTRLAATILR